MLFNNPRIAVIGFGAAGVGFTHALRNAGYFSSDATTFKPHITVYEAGSVPGGKMAPRNLGAQFLDAELFYPMDRIVKDLKLEVLEAREDYDNAPFLLKNETEVSAEDFLKALIQFRKVTTKALQSSWTKLDQWGGVGFVNDLRRKGYLTAHQAEAMTGRLKLEEGTTQISALSLAINLAKGVSPMHRIEIKGGLNKIALAESLALTSMGSEILLKHRVRRIDATGNGVKVYIQGDSIPHRHDYVLIAASPEQIRGINIQGSNFPYELLEQLIPARITKSNVWTKRKHHVDDYATGTYAVWPTDFYDGKRTLHGATFFHGWEGQKALTTMQMEHAIGLKHYADVIEESKIWDGRGSPDILPAAYTTMPHRRHGFGIVNTINKFLIQGEFSRERVSFANHVLGAGCYTRDAALAGEWSAIWVLRSLGFSIERALANRSYHHSKDFFGVERTKIK